MNWIGNFKLRTRLLAGFISVAIITGLVGTIGYFNIHRVADNDKSLYEQNMVSLGNLVIMSNSFQRTRVNIRDVLTSRNATEREKFMKRIGELSEEVNLQFAKYRKVDATDEERQMSQTFENAWTTYQTTLKKIADLDGAGRRNEAIELMRGQGIETAKVMNDIMDKMIDRNEREAKRKSDENSRVSVRAEWTMLIFNVASMLLAIVLGVLITRSITRPLQAIGTAAEKIAGGDLEVNVAISGSDELGSLAGQFNVMVGNVRNVIEKINTSTVTLASSSEELAATSDELRKGAQELSGQTEQIVSAMTEVSQTIMDMAKNASQASEASKISAESANTGKEVVQANSAGMSAIAETVRGAAGTIEELGKNSAHIGEIVAVINGIADQTNLLALNAAIEAARAGEQGRGFAVVADEVRKLAERTSQATKDIANKISAIQSAATGAVEAMKTGQETVNKGVTLSSKTSASLDAIVDASRNATDMVHRIAAATDEQSAATEQVTQNMENIASITRNTAASTDQIRVSADSLAKLAVDLKDSVAWFKLNGAKSSTSITVKG